MVNFTYKDKKFCTTFALEFSVEANQQLPVAIIFNPPADKKQTKGTKQKTIMATKKQTKKKADKRKETKEN